MTQKFLKTLSVLLLFTAAQRSDAASVVISDLSRQARADANVFNRTTGINQTATPSKQSFTTGSFSGTFSPHSQITNAVADGSVTQNSTVSVTDTSIAISGSANGSGSVSLTPNPNGSNAYDARGAGIASLNCSFTLTEPFSFSLNVSSSAGEDSVTEIRLRGGSPTMTYIFGSDEVETGGNITGTLSPGDYTFTATLTTEVELAATNQSISGTQNAMWSLDFQAQKVPEPGALGLLGGSALLLGARRRKRG